MLVFHGNAGYALHRDYFVAGFQALGDEWQVFLFEYPGYGARKGMPSAATFKATAVQALAHYRSPVAFLIAGRDEVVTTELGQQLYDSYTGPKWLRVEGQAGHNTLPYHPGAAWWGEVSKFLTSRH